MASLEHCIAYVRLLNEGTTVYRPVKAKLVRSGVVQILPVEHGYGGTEEWEFQPGDTVAVRTQNLDGAEVLVAVARAV